MDDDVVRVGMIGSGYMGRSYAECLKRYCQGGRLTAVFGGSRAPKLAADYEAAHAASLEELLARDDVDAVLVTSPHTAHLEPERLEAFYTQVQDFVDSVRERRPPAVTGEHG